jgi:hypothetical protein
MISWGYGWYGSGWVYLGLVGLVHGMQQVRSLCARFLVFYRGDGETCGLCSVLATRVRPVS